MKRRSFITGALAAPLIVKTPGILMPVKKIIHAGPEVLIDDFSKFDAAFTRHLARTFLQKFEIARAVGPITNER